VDYIGKDWMVGKCGLDGEGLNGMEVWIRLGRIGW